VNLKELRDAVRSAVTKMEDAYKAFDEAPEDATDIDELRAAFEAATAEHRAAKQRLEGAEAVEEARKAAPIEPVEDDQPASEERGAPSPKVRVGDEPHTYEKHGRHSFLGDMYAARITGNRKAEERLHRHQHEMDVDGRGEERALSSTDSEGGYLVAPLYLQNEFVTLARAGRPTANAVRSLPLPANTDSINIPKMESGTATEGQKDNEAVKSTDATFGTLEAPVRTVSGQQDMSRQVFDRSLPAVEDLILADLAADYATKVDVDVLSGSGTAPHVKGILTVSGTNVVTYTDSEPTLAKLYPKGSDAIQRIYTGRYMPPSAWIMHPRRWAWFQSALDTTNRPLALLGQNAPWNAAALVERLGPENVVGQWLGLPVIIDPSIPTTEKVKVGEAEKAEADPIICARLDDIYLWEEGDINRATYFEVLSGSLGVRVQVYGYLAFLAERYKKAISVISGSGLIAPAF